MITQDNYKVNFSDDYSNNELYQFEVESKGCLFGTHVEINNKSYAIDFYDSIRFKQDIDEELKSSKYHFNDTNIVFLEKVNLKNIVEALNHIYNEGLYKRMNNA